MKNAIVALLLIVIVVGGGYLLMQRLPVPAVSNQAGNTDIAGWATYIDPDNQFSFQYPADEFIAIPVEEMIYTSSGAGYPASGVQLLEKSGISSGVGRQYRGIHFLYLGAQTLANIQPGGHLANKRSLTVGGVTGTTWDAGVEDYAAQEYFIAPDDSHAMFLKEIYFDGSSAQTGRIQNASAIIGTLKINTTGSQNYGNVPYNGTGGAEEIKPYAEVYNTYNHSDFTFKYPMMVGGSTAETQIMGLGDRLSHSGFTPACSADQEDAILVGCIVVPESAYSVGSFENASFAVFQSLKTGENGCYNSRTPGSSAEDVVINGVNFHSYIYSDAATGHYSDGMSYRVFHNNTCFELATRINTTVFSGLDISKANLTTDQQAALEGALLSIVKSFKFTK